MNHEILVDKTLLMYSLYMGSFFMKFGPSIYLFFLLSIFSLQGLACLEIPQTIPIDNSPFSFREITITSTSFSFPDTNGKPTNFNCQKKDDGSTEWVVSDAGENGDKDRTISMETLVGAQGQFGGYIPLDGHESTDRPSLTGGVFGTDGNAATLNIHLLDRSRLDMGQNGVIRQGTVNQNLANQNSLQVRCATEDGINFIEILVMNSEGQQIGTVSAARMEATRGLSIPRTNPDMNGGGGQSINFSGCGAQGFTPSSTPTQRVAE